MTNDVWQAELRVRFAELGGDPVIGKQKRLIVGCRLDGAAKVITFDTEGKQLHVSLP